MDKIKINKKADEIIIVVSRLAQMNGISSQEILDNIMEEYKKTECKKLFTAEETDSIIHAFESMHGYSTDKLITAYSSMRDEKDNKLEIFEGMLLSIYFMLSITNPELFEKYEEENNG